jgi:Uma2 family endonuclease
MNLALRKPMTLPEFLAWEELQEPRYEFDGAHSVAMTGGTARHELIGNALRGILRNRLRGKPCLVFGPTIKIEAAGSIRYPDAFISCTPVSGDAKVISRPVIVFEILSPSTSRTDRIVKLREYRATESIRQYVILEQSSIAATLFTREGEFWNATALTEGDTLSMPEIDVELALAEIYSDVTLPAPDERDDEGLADR